MSDMRKRHWKAEQSLEGRVLGREAKGESNLMERGEVSKSEGPGDSKGKWAREGEQAAWPGRRAGKSRSEESPGKCQSQ